MESFIQTKFHFTKALEEKASSVLTGLTNLSMMLMDARCTLPTLLAGLSSGVDNALLEVRQAGAQPL